MTFEEFLSSELEGLDRYARLLCGDRQSAHDLTADTLVDASKRWDRIGGLDMPVSYVRRMLTNRHIDQLRRRRLTLRVHRLSAPEVPAADPARGVEQRAFLDDLLRQLPARQRAALVCRYYLDMPDDQIGRELGVGASSVRSMIARGLETIRKRTSSDDVRTHLP